MLYVAAAPLAAQNQAASRDQRYQIGVMERVLEQAVEHGAARTRERLQAVLPPAEMLLSATARVRGFRLEGYGVLFDVEVPDLPTSLPWSFLMLDQNGLGLASALQQLRSIVEKTGDTNAEQALKRIELQVAPVGLSASSALAGARPPALAPAATRTVAGSAAATSADALAPAPTVAGSAAATGADALAPATRTVAGSAAVTGADALPPASADPILNSPQEAYREEVRVALIDAMLMFSKGIDVAPGEWLHVAAKRNDDQPRLAPVDTDAATLSIRVRGADLTAFLGGQITKDEAIRRMEVKMF
jgi:hypothetical protein